MVGISYKRYYMFFEYVLLGGRMCYYMAVQSLTPVSIAGEKERYMSVFGKRARPNAPHPQATRARTRTEKPPTKNTASRIREIPMAKELIPPRSRRSVITRRVNK